MNRVNNMSPNEAELKFYKEHPKTCEPEDFWSQVKRTVNGKPVPQDQIDMIVQAVYNGLDLSEKDIFLDLCCGNGALTTYFFDKCHGGLGIDFSEYLVGIARKFFMKHPNEDYLLQDVLEFARTYTRPDRFTKALCYGSIQYLPKQSVDSLLNELRNRFINLQSLFIGNVPDKEFVMNFFKDKYEQGVENSPHSPIGIWWSKEEFTDLAKSTGWIPKFSTMPQEFYSAHYRYDVILTPAMEQQKDV